MENGAMFEMKPHNNPEKTLSIPVVQELAKTIGSDTSLPQRYIRDLGINNSALSLDHDVGMMLPIIDFAVTLSEENMDARLQEMKKLSAACEEWGFFQIGNHGVPTDCIQKLKENCKEFFDLPLTEKMKCRQANDIQGYGQLFVVSDEQPLDWADMLYLEIFPPHLRQTEVWPRNPQDFSEALISYATQAQSLATTLMRVTEHNLGLKPGTFEGYCEGWKGQIRINYYPPCPRPDQALGISSRSDASCFTILLQAGDAAGLQIKKNDQWYLVQPLQHALVVNVGDFMEVMTNGKYRSIEHRAISNKEQERISVATFFLPGPGQEAEPAAELLGKMHPSLYKKISADDYFHVFASRRLEGKKALSDYLTPSQR